MAEKLKLITRPIPWSLLLKALSLALLWAFGKASLAAGAATPFWLFVVAACAAYFLPLFRPRATAAPFLCAMVLSFLVPFSALATLAFAILFFLILGIKDLILIDRETAYEALFFLLIFLGAVLAYAAAGAWSESGSWMPLFVVGIMMLLLSRKLPWRDPPRERQAIVPALVFGLLAFEFSLVLLFLPLDFLYQASILFLFVVFSAYALVRLRRGETAFQPFLYYFFALALAAGFILTLNTWRI